MYLILATTNGFNFELNSSLKESIGVLYSTANDPQPQMIPKMDRK